MADTDRLRAYKRSNPPSLPDNGKFVAEELKRIEQTLGTISDVLKLLEARIVSLEP
jgi:hypothetical protein